MKTKKIDTLTDGFAASDGAGVQLKRLIHTPHIDMLDPFLLLDEFRSDNPDDYLAGFPDHPHRGFETVTYMIAGRFKHTDSTGNSQEMGPGDVQWMTAGRGIIHSEMPIMEDGLVWGYQLWLNLPAKLKMTEPRYQHLDGPTIPVVEKDGLKVKLIAGEFDGTQGAAETLLPATYFDVELAAGAVFEYIIPAGRQSFAHMLTGKVEVEGETAGIGQAFTLGEGELVRITAQEDSRFLFIAAEPIGEPVARMGPFVMNTQQELHQAYMDMQTGRFLAPN